jgi:hypothetical protein
LKAAWSALTFQKDIINAIKQLSGIGLPIRRGLLEFSRSACASIVHRRVAVEGHMPNETPGLSLTEVHRDAINAANSSWSETDKLYISVCVAFITLTGIFGWDKSGSKIWIAFATILLRVLAINWIILISHYRCQILCSLKALSEGNEISDIRTFFANEHKRVYGYRNDYLVSVVILLIGVVLLVIIILPSFTHAFDWLNKAAS